MPPLPKGEKDDPRRSITPLGQFLEMTKENLIKLAMIKLEFAIKESLAVKSKEPESLTEQVSALFTKV